jgi:hypothetical protein
MVKLELVLSPDEADMILRAIDRAREVHAEPAPVEAPPEEAVSPKPPEDVSAETCHDALRSLEGTVGRSGWWSDIVH